MKSNLEKTFEKKVEQKKKSSRKVDFKRRFSRVSAIIGVGVGLIVALNLVIYIHRTHVENVRMENLDNLADQRAEIVALAVEKYVDAVWAQIHSFAKRPTITSAITADNNEPIETLEQQLLDNIEGAFAVNFIAKDKLALDQNTTPPIRFTELEMMQRALAREQVLPEAAKVDNKWILNFVYPLPYDENQEAIAVMMVSLDTESLQHRVYQDKLSLGQIGIDQQFGAAKPLVVFSSGVGNTGRTVVKKVNSTYWNVRFTPSFAMLESARVNAIPAYLFMALAVVFALLAGYFGGLRMGSVIEQKIDERRKKKNLEGSAVANGAVGVAAAAARHKDTNILDVDIAREDQELLGLREAEGKAAKREKDDDEDILEIAEDEQQKIPDVVFRAYDIRGVAKTEITTDLAQKIGKAVGSEAIDNGQDTLVVARDARLTSPELTEYLVRGILSSGCHVLNIGTVPTPLLYFATCTLPESQSGVMVTASHNPGEYNGFKIVMNGKPRCDQDIKAIRKRIMNNDLYDGAGKESRADIVDNYVDTIFSDVALAGDVSIVIDAANGVTGKVAPRLFEELGCHVTPLFCDLDGNFPNHSPDPSIEKNLQALKEKVQETNADLGIAFDGDGDRLIVISSSGKVIWPDQLLMLFAKDIVSRNPGADVVFDVKSTRHLAGCITSYGGRPIMWKTGHGPMKEKMLETGALLGGEYSGHIFIKDRWYGFDDGMYSAARLIEIVSLHGEPIDELFTEFPVSPATPEIRVPVGEARKFEIVKELAAKADFGDGRVTTIDGVRVDFPYGWGLVRASNTSANLTLRFEADDEAALHKLKSVVTMELKKVDKTLIIDWGS